MSKMLMFAALSVFLVIGIVLTGCSGQEGAQDAAPSPDASQDQPATDGHEGHEHEGGEHETHSGHAGHSEHEAALAELSPADRALAEKQETCPVSGQPLGSMGKPYKITVEGREVFLCCSGCESKIRENPEEYLAKLPK